MKYTIFILAFLSIGLSEAIADEAKNEEQCKTVVDQTVKSLAEQSKRYGEIAMLDDLSDDKILELQNKKGSCVAMNEINSRLNPK